jgi:hypothetical protein
MEQEITAILENVACLGRSAYGRYIENMTKHIVNMVQTEATKKLDEIFKVNEAKKES